MANRLIHTTFSEYTQLTAAKVYWNSELEEYTVKLIIRNKYYPDADYFTNDKQDALASALAMVSGANASRDGEQYHF
jgi:hypothetical protein